MLTLRARLVVLAGLMTLVGVLTGAAAASASSLSEFTVKNCTNAVRGLVGIAAGPDGNLWFTDPVGGIGRISPTGSSTCFPLPPGGQPSGIVAGPDGNVWFVDDGANAIGRITPSGAITEFPIPTSSSFLNSAPRPSDIALGPDGNLWFTELGANQIGQITPGGTITEFPLPTDGAHPNAITAGPDGNLYFTEPDAGQIGQITPDGDITEFPIPTPDPHPNALAFGPDGSLWFTDSVQNEIVEVTPDFDISLFVVPTPDSGLAAITAGPDGNMWFTESGANQVGRITPDGAISESHVNAPLGITSGSDDNLWISESAPKSNLAFPENAVERMGPGPIPVNTAAPGISGSLQQGQTLTEHHGTWTNSPIAYTHQWERCDPATGACSAIAGATAPTYVLTAADVGRRIRVEETAFTAPTAFGDPAASATTAVVQSGLPGSVSPPAIAGAPRTGATLSEAHGTWTNGPIDGYAYHWERCDRNGANCSDILGATSQVYQPTTADLGHTLRVQESADNALGQSAVATSPPTAVVQSATGTVTVGRVQVSGTTASAVVGCAGAVGATCRIAATLSVIETLRGRRILAISARSRTKLKVTRKLLVLGASLVTLSRGGKLTMRVQLGAVGRRLLAAHHPLQVRLALTQTVSSGNVVTIASRTLTFKSRPTRT